MRERVCSCTRRGFYGQRDICAHLYTLWFSRHPRGNSRNNAEAWSRGPTQHWLTDRGRTRLGPSRLPSDDPPATLFSRSALLKRAILSSLPAASALRLDNRMAPVTVRHERSSKMHSRVVGLHLQDHPFDLPTHPFLGHHRFWTCRTHRRHLPGPGQSQACPLRGFHGQRFRRRWSTDHNH